MVFLWFPGFPMSFLVSPWFSHGFPMVFLWFSWFSYGFLVFPWFSHGFPMVFLWFSWFSYDFPGFPMVFPWFSHGFPLVSLVSHTHLRILCIQVEAFGGALTTLQQLQHDLQMFRIGFHRSDVSKLTIYIYITTIFWWLLSITISQY